MAEGNFLYLKLYNQVKEDIESGKYQPGEKLPPEAELRRQFGICECMHVTSLQVEQP